MPVIDMPLEALKKYQGINPRPADFDAYWEAGLTEMSATDPEVRRRAFRAKRYFVRHPEERPFSSPFYWAPFTYSGV